MYNPMGLTKGLSLTKIIGGISKTLQIANQVIPLYQKTKPIINNARSIFSVLKEIKAPSNTKTTTIKENINNEVNIDNESLEVKKVEASTPTFFL